MSTTAKARVTTSYLQATILSRPVHAVVDAAGPVVAHPVEVGGHRLEVDAHLGDLVLHLGVVGHRARQRDRRALVHCWRRCRRRPAGRSTSRRRRSRAAPRRTGRRGTGRRRRTRRGTRGSSPRRARTCGRGSCRSTSSPACRGCPTSPRCGSSGVSRSTKRVHDLRVGRVAGVHGVHAEVGPHRRQAAEDLVAGDLPAAVDALAPWTTRAAPGCRCRPRRGRRRTRGPSAALAQHPVAGGVAGAVQVGAQPDEVVVHVDGDRGRRRDVGDAALQPVDLGEVQARPPPKLGRQRGREVAAGAQLLEVLVEERGSSRSYSGARSSKRASISSVSRSVTSGAVMVVVIGSLLWNVVSVDRPT